MRIISGIYKGRKIDGYDIEGTRPTMDRVKESIFAMIQNNIQDKVVLDLFSGSGNYALEALSNGAKEAYFNDYNMECINIIKKNISGIKVSKKYTITNKDYKDALILYKNRDIKFDLVFLDPPYKLEVHEEILNYLVKNDLLNDKALVVVELINNNLQEQYDNLKLLKERKYGEKTVLIYQKEL